MHINVIICSIITTIIISTIIVTILTPKSASPATPRQAAITASLKMITYLFLSLSLYIYI